MNHTLNGIALQLPADDRHRLAAICAPVELVAGQRITPAPVQNQEPQVFFLDGATVSLWIEAGPDHPALAVTLLGHEGMVGFEQLWGSENSLWSARVLTSGPAHAASASKFRQLLGSSPSLLMAVSQFLWNQTQEIAQLSARMLLGDIRTRLALWLHLMRDKSGSDTIPITHDILARMLGTRRVSITLLAGELQSEGVLALRRGAIHIRDAEALTRLAGLQQG